MSLCSEPKLPKFVTPTCCNQEIYLSPITCIRLLELLIKHSAKGFIDRLLWGLSPEIHSRLMLSDYHQLRNRKDTQPRWTPHTVWWIGFWASENTNSKLSDVNFLKRWWVLRIEQRPYTISFLMMCFEISMCPSCPEKKEINVSSCSKSDVWKRSQFIWWSRIH